MRGRENAHKQLDTFPLARVHTQGHDEPGLKTGSCRWCFHSLYTSCYHRLFQEDGIDAQEQKCHPTTQPTLKQ